MRWLTPDELSAWLTYVATASLLDGALDRQLQRESGMPMAYYLILAMLSDVPGRTLRMSDLVETKRDVCFVEGFADQIAAGGGDVGVFFAEDLLRKRREGSVGRCFSRDDM